MPTEIALITNCDDAVVFWRIPKRIPGCWGFAIERERRRDGVVQRITLDNRMGFAKDHPKVGEHRPSTVWPFQRFWWADYAANLGDTVRYRVTPMVMDGGALHELVSAQSDWTKWTELSAGKKDGYASYFNRGLVISQFMARYLEDLRVKEHLATRKDALAAFKKSLDEHELPIRVFLSGALRARMLRMLAEAKQAGQHVYAALYELDDDELIQALGKLGKRAHVVLANGSITARKGESAADARKRDENKTGRAALRKLGVEVFDRFVSPGALAHNKFLVVANVSSTKTVKPKTAWTGSTNWTSTGLCTQINNGLFVDDAAVASQYFDQWTRLRDAQSAFPASLVAANDQPKAVKTGGSDARIWFTRTEKKVDLAALDEVVNGAQEAVLFLMFQPGGSGTLKTVRTIEQKKKSLYVKGVVSTLPPEAQDDESKVTVNIHGADTKPLDLNVVQPEGALHPFANWAATVTRDEFLSPPVGHGVVGFAIVHSKLIVVDPFTKPVVVTGSHNFSGAASGSNDENFMIVRGNGELALHYAAHILAVYHHYRWLAFVNDMQRKGKSPSGVLKETDTWQDEQLKGDTKREIDFWVR